MLKGRRTEAEQLNRRVVQRGRELGVPTPMNETVIEVTKRMEAGELRRDPANLRFLTLPQWIPRALAPEGLPAPSGPLGATEEHAWPRP